MGQGGTRRDWTGGVGQGGMQDMLWQDGTRRVGMGKVGLGWDVIDSDRIRQIVTGSDKIGWGQVYHAMHFATPFFCCTAFMSMQLESPQPNGVFASSCFPSGFPSG